MKKPFFIYVNEHPLMPVKAKLIVMPPPGKVHYVQCEITFENGWTYTGTDRFASPSWPAPERMGHAIVDAFQNMTRSISAQSALVQAKVLAEVQPCRLKKSPSTNSN